MIGISRAKIIVFNKIWEECVKKCKENDVITEEDRVLENFLSYLPLVFDKHTQLQLLFLNSFPSTTSPSPFPPSESLSPLISSCPFSPYYVFFLLSFPSSLLPVRSVAHLLVDPAYYEKRYLLKFTFLLEKSSLVVSSLNYSLKVLSTNKDGFRYG
jgi:hypothetical protein